MTKLLTTAATAAVLTIASASAAHATAVYDASASAELSITSVVNVTDAANGTEDLFVLAQALEFDEDVTTTGDAVATAMSELFPTGDVASLTGDSALLNASFATGTATDGTASSFNFTQGFMTVENASFTDSFQVTFELSYDLAITTATDTTGETVEGFAGLFSDITGDDGLGNALGRVLVDLILDPTTAQSASDTIVFDLLLNPGGFIDLVMTADAEGTALGVAMDVVDPDVVPLPGALGFMVVGLAGAAAARRRAAA